MRLFKQIAATMEEDSQIIVVDHHEGLRPAFQKVIQLAPK